MVMNYIRMNKYIKNFDYPAPDPDVTKQKVAGYKYYSVIDMKSGFHLLNVHKDSRKYTAFSANGKVYQFKRVPFGIKIAPALFNHWVQSMVSSCNEFCRPYFDDAIIFSNSLEEHLEHIKTVLRIFRENKVYVGKSKIQLFKKEVKFCGHLISQDGIKVLESKTKAIEAMPYPTNIQQLKSFIGSIVYYSKFVPNYSEITASLTDLLKGSPGPSKKITLNEQQRGDIDRIKSILINADTLMAADTSRKFHVYTDASDVGIGAMISQYDKSGIERPVLYFSKKLDQHQRNYDTRDRELLAICETLDKHDWLLKGRQFYLYTDHMNLLYMENSKDKLKRLCRWGEFLSHYDYEVKYLKGEENVIPDMLSRNPNFYLDWDLEFAKDVIKSYKSKESSEWFQALQRRKDVAKSPEGLVYLIDDNKRLVLVSDKQIEIVLQEAHATTYGGHVGKERLGAKLRKLYYWKNFWGTIEKFVKACHNCQKNKIEVIKQGFLNPLPIPDRPFKHISTDYMKLIESEDGYDNVFVVVDRLSKMVKLWPCKSTVTTRETAEWFFNNIVCQFGIPQSIVSDQDSKFTADLWTDMMKKLDSKMAMTQPGRAQADGQTERMNRTIKEIIIKESTQRKNWSSRIHMIEAALNFNVNTSTKLSPVSIVYGFEPKFPLNSHSNEIEDFNYTREINIQKAKDNMLDAQINQAIYHDRDKTDDLEYIPGDLILVKRSRLNTAKFAKPTDLTKELKLLPIYCGPFKVISKSDRNDLNYVIQINNSRKGKRTVHISDTKLFNQDDKYFLPANKKINPVLNQEVEMIVAHRERTYGKINKSTKTSYLVRFEGLSEDHDWWITEDYLTDYQDLIDQYRKSDKFKEINTMKKSSTKKK